MKQKMNWNFCLGFRASRGNQQMSKLTAKQNIGHVTPKVKKESTSSVKWKIKAYTASSLSMLSK